MAQNLTISWITPLPKPSCGYEVFYRANGIPSYTLVNTSGTTSGATSLSILGLPPACYEGFVQSNCCGDNLSDITTSTFGVNAYQPLFASVHLYPFPPADPSQYRYQLILSSLYPNPYNTLVTGSFMTNWPSPTTIPFSETYAAGSTYTEYFFSAPGFPNITVLSALTITSVVPIFDNGGTLQQFDAVSTPQYFQLYNTSGCTSGSTSGCTSPTWNGSPLKLPSFILRAFNVTATDSFGVPIAGNLIVTWIQNALYGGGTGIYSTITFNVYDPSTAIMGSVIVPYGKPGLNSATIHVTKVSAPLSISTQFTMTTLWADTSLSATQLFYLPSF